MSDDTNHGVAISTDLDAWLAETPTVDMDAVLSLLTEHHKIDAITEVTGAEHTLCEITATRYDDAADAVVASVTVRAPGRLDDDGCFRGELGRLTIAGSPVGSHGVTTARGDEQRWAAENAIAAVVAKLVTAVAS